MPLFILLPLVVLGIAGLVGLVHLLGHSTPLALPDEDTVRKHWQRHFPDDRIDGPRYRVTPEEIEAFRADGYVHLRGVLTEEA